MASTDFPMQPHPFYPAEFLLPDYIPNDLDVASLMFSFASVSAVIFSMAYLIGDDLKLSDRLIVVWFVMCGFIHCFFEGYFVYNHDRMPSRMDVFGQLWKEYALSDSRYIFCDPLLLCMEVFSVFMLGPLSFFTAWLITSDSGYRHSLQVLVSTGHIYSNLLYFATSLYDGYYLGKHYYRPEPFYFWAYFVGMNAIWLVIPGILLCNSMRVSAKAFVELKDHRRKIKALYNTMKDTRTRVKAN